MELDATEIVECNIEVRVHEPPDIPLWDYLPTSAKMLISRYSGEVNYSAAKNTTTEDMHEWLVGRTDPFGSQTPDIEELAVGRSNATTAETDSSLTDEVDRASVTSTSRETDTLRVRTFLDKNVGNVDVSSGESLSEVGLYAGDYFLNHGILTNDIDKTDNKTATVDVLIIYAIP